MPTIETRNDSIDIDETPEVKLDKLETIIESSQPLISIDHSSEKDKSKVKVDELIVKIIPWPLPFSQRIRNKKVEEKYPKFLSMLKELCGSRGPLDILL